MERMSEYNLLPILHIVTEQLLYDNLCSRKLGYIPEQRYQESWGLILSGGER